MAVLSGNQIAALIVEAGSGMPTVSGVTLLKPAKDDGNGNVTIGEHSAEARRKAIRFLDVAIAVCLAESGGNTGAKNSSSSASGLWQIMVSVHRDKIADEIKRWEAESGKSGLTIFDPYVNTGVASRVFQAAGGWSPWEAYNTGAYKRHLGKGKAAYEALNSPANLERMLNRLNNEREYGIALGQAAAGAVPFGALLNNDMITSPDALLGKALAFLKDSGIVIGLLLIALVLFILGAWLLLSQTAPVKKAVKALT